jgi:D-3-phosphoglycerate dehydrogenase
MKYKLLVTGPEIATKAKKTLEKNNFKVLFVPNYSSSKLLADIAKKEQIDALLVRMGGITQDVLTASPRLKVVAKHGVGVNNIDIKAATELNIPVFITLNGNYQSVAEHTVALIYGLTKEIVRLDGRLRKGYWDKPGYKGVELNKKSLGLIGLGRIARRVIELVRPLNMDIIGYDPYVSKDKFPREVKAAKNLDEVLSYSDYISVHCPLTKETRNLIDEEEFKKMKKEAFIVNTARGGIINEISFIKALKHGWIAGAGLDTFSLEPPQKDNPLWEMSNIIVTPHIGGVTEESFNRIGVESVQHILSIINNKKVVISACVNPQVLKKGVN